LSSLGDPATVNEYFLTTFCDSFREIFKSSALNFVRIRRDLTFLSNIVCGLLFPGCNVVGFMFVCCMAEPNK